MHLPQPGTPRRSSLCLYLQALRLAVAAASQTSGSALQAPVGCLGQVCKTSCGGLERQIEAASPDLDVLM